MLTPRHAFLVSLLIPLALACSSDSPEEVGNTGGTGGGGQGGASSAQPDAGLTGGAGGGGDSGGSGGSNDSGGSTGSGGSSDSGGSTGSAGSGGSAAGGAGGAGDSVSCTPLANGCTCADVPPAANAVMTCSATSVADKPGSKGTCCKGSFSCRCEAFACVQDSSSNFCSCGRASSTTAVLKGPIVPDCSGAVARDPLKVKCCKSPDRCTCRVSDCLAGLDEEVPNCSLSDVMGCESGQTSVPACK